jgi:hypothetical protein
VAVFPAPTRCLRSVALRLRAILANRFRAASLTASYRIENQDFQEAFCENQILLAGCHRIAFGAFRKHLFATAWRRAPATNQFTRCFHFDRP